MAKLTIRDLASVDVEMWDKTFETIPATRSVERNVAALERQLTELPDDDTDKMVELTAQVIDLRLKPKGNARKKAGELVIEKWQADELTLDALLQFVNDLGAADRPT
jgi:hypothetical protein